MKSSCLYLWIPLALAIPWSSSFLLCRTLFLLFCLIRMQKKAFLFIGGLACVFLSFLFLSSKRPCINITLAFCSIAVAFEREGTFCLSRAEKY